MSVPVIKRIVLKEDYYQPVPDGGVKASWWFKKGDDITGAQMLRDKSGYMAIPRTTNLSVIQGSVPTFAAPMPVFVPSNVVKIVVLNTGDNDLPLQQPPPRLPAPPTTNDNPSTGPLAFLQTPTGKIVAVFTVITLVYIIFKRQS